MANNLTDGAIALICSGDTQAAESKPVLQVADIRLVNTQQQQNSNERYRLLLSDGCHLQQGMLATQRNELVKSGRLQKGSIVQLIQFVCNVIQGRMIIIIIDLDVVLEKCDPIGEPKQYVPGGPSVSTLSSVDHSTARPATAQSFSTKESTTRVNMGGGVPEMNPKVGGSMESPAYGSSYNGNLNPRHNATTNTPYGRTNQPAYQQPPPMYINRGPVSKNEAPQRIIPISALNPYQGRWTIKARVTAKGDLRHYNNPRGDGKVFSFDLLDSDGGEIRATCFNAVADQFFNQIEPGKVYMVSKGTLKPAQKNFNHLRNDYEITLDNMSTVQLCYGDDGSIPHQQFNFRPINDIEGMENNTVVDVIGVVTFISPTASIMRKNGTETQKRTLHLKDMSGCSVELTLWGNLCISEGQTLQSLCDSGSFPVLAAKACRVNDFSGKAVSTIATSLLFINPEFPEAHRLREWFGREGCNTPSVSISREFTGTNRTDARKVISQIKEERLGTSEKPDWITIAATISFLKVENFCYTACPIMIGDRQCNKKVTNNGDGKWRCDRCDQVVNDCDYRYILQFQIQDHTGMTWVTAFQESGEEIIGVPAKDMYYLKYEEQDDERFGEIIRRVLFSQYVFKLKVKEEMFSDEQRVKSTVVKAEKVNYSSESKFMLESMMKPGYEDKSGGFGQHAGTKRPASAMLDNREMGQYGYSRPSSGGLYMNCSRCGGSGHASVNCPSLMNQPAQSASTDYIRGGGGSSGQCFKCQQFGHWARDCPGMSNAGPTYGGMPKHRVGGF